MLIDEVMIKTNDEVYTVRDDAYSRSRGDKYPPVENNITILLSAS